MTLKQSQTPKQFNNSTLRFVGNLVAFLFALLVIEGASRAAFFVLNDQWFNTTTAIQHLDGVLNLDKNKIDDLIAGKQSILHPYVGYVYNPEGWKIKHDGVSISDFGFIDDKTPVLKKSDDKLIIGVFGGSVAWWFQQLGRETMLEELRNTTLLKGKEPVIIRLALGGYKQPQQLLLLSYLLSLGAEFDVVLNIDGYNEVALPPFHNIPHGVNPFFPINWREQVLSTSSKTMLLSLGKKTLLDEKRRWAASMAQSYGATHLCLLHLAWFGYDRLLYAQSQAAALSILPPQSTDSLPFYAAGPPYTTNDSTIYSQLAKVWQNSSLAMNALCQSHGCKYFHILQPNQYVPDSKPMSDEERKTVIAPPDVMNKGVLEGYPALMKAGAQLRSRGVAFVDLTQTFKHTTEPTYNDTCCHLSELGNNVLGSAIGKYIAEQTKQSR